MAAAGVGRAEWQGDLGIRGTFWVQDVVVEWALGTAVQEKAPGG